MNNRLIFGIEEWFQESHNNTPNITEDILRNWG